MNINCRMKTKRKIPFENFSFRVWYSRRRKKKIWDAKRVFHSSLALKSPRKKCSKKKTSEDSKRNQVAYGMHFEQSLAACESKANWKDSSSLFHDVTCRKNKKVNVGQYKVKKSQNRARKKEKLGDAEVRFQSERSPSCQVIFAHSPNL